jgi:hypothetical protein
VETLAGDIRAIYKKDPLRAEVLIEAYLDQSLKQFSSREKMGLLEELGHQFENLRPKAPFDLDFESKAFSQLFSLLLGKKISEADVSCAEVSEKLAHSLNTIFNTLNQIIRVIQTTLFGEKAEFDETIRHIIRSNLEGSAGAVSLQSYLDQIQEAFLVAHQAFKKAAQTKLGEILEELNPDQIEATPAGSLKFGPLRKAEFFETYKEKFRACRDWFESGRFTEELSREFEKTCQKLYHADRRLR